MDRILLLLLALFLVPGGCATTSLPHLTSTTSADSLRNKTIALVESSWDGTSWRTFCSGVWVSENRILTAKHCVSDVQPGEMVSAASFSDVSGWGGDPTIGSVFKVKVVKTSDAEDLALLASTTLRTDHDWAEVADSAQDGQAVWIVGQTSGALWHLLPGTIAEARAVPTISGAGTEHVWRIVSSAWYGNSGGGAFSEGGDLIGICSFGEPRTPLSSYFVHTRVIRDFLGK